MFSLATLALGLALSAPAKEAAPSFKKVVVVYLENTDYRGAFRQSFLKALAGRGALLTDFHAETHPSQPNYIALAAGTTEGVHGDDNSDLDERHLGDLLEDAGRSWKVYAEGYPGGCWLEKKTGRYARKHVPFLSFVNVQKNPARCARIVAETKEAESLKKDFKDGTLADFSFYAPDLDDDGHDTGVKHASRWLEKAFGPLIDDSAFASGVLLVVTFDEDDSLGDNHIYTVLFGDGVAPGTTSGVRYSHYSLLRTIEDRWSLGSLGKGDQKALPISGVWRDKP